jgi:hypothetical protein
MHTETGKEPEAAVSFELTNAVWDLTDIEPTAKLVLLRLADMANHTGRAWPSVSRLVADTGLARSSVFRILKNLEERHFIIRNSSGSTNNYFVSVAGVNSPTMTLQWSDHETSATMRLVPPSDGGGLTVGRGVVPPSDSTSPTIGPKPLRTTNRTTNEPSNGGSSGKGLNLELPFTSLEFQEAWRSWEQHRKEIRKKLTPESVRRQFKSFLTWGEQKSIQLIDLSISRGWQGIFDQSQSNGSRHAQTTSYGGIPTINEKDWAEGAEGYTDEDFVFRKDETA